MIKSIKILLFIFSFIIIRCSSSSVFSEKEIVIKIKGSDTMLHLTKKLVEEYSTENPSVKFRVFGGGTESGIEELLHGRIDIATASRNLSSIEAKSLAEYYGSIGMYYLIAKDAVSIYVNTKSPIENLTLSELGKIFTCEFTDLKDLNLGKGRIELAIRESGSGTRKYLKDFLIPNKEFCDSAKVFSTTEEIIEFVQNRPGGLGFGGLGLANNVKLVSIDGIASNVQNAKNDSYPLTRYLHFFTTRTPSVYVKKFIDWSLSPAGQLVIKKEGFIPLWEINY